MARNEVTTHVWDASKVTIDGRSLWGSEVKIGGSVAKIDGHQLSRVDFKREVEAKQWASKVAQNLRNLVEALEE